MARQIVLTAGNRFTSFIKAFFVVELITVLIIWWGGSCFVGISSKAKWAKVDPLVANKLPLCWHVSDITWLHIISTDELLSLKSSDSTVTATAHKGVIHYFNICVVWPNLDPSGLRSTPILNDHYNMKNNHINLLLSCKKNVIPSPSDWHEKKLSAVFVYIASQFYIARDYHLETSIFQERKKNIYWKSILLGWWLFFSTLVTYLFH